MRVAIEWKYFRWHEMEWMNSFEMEQNKERKEKKENRWAFV